MSEALLTRLRDGGKRALADALARIEASPTEPETVDLLDEAYHHAKGYVIGITGPPGVGKSTLIAAMVDIYRKRDETVGVIAIDPSSRLSGGALLGDRVRIDTDPADAGVFIRSMAARDWLGGLAANTWSSVALMRAVYDRVIVETVGVGQSETDINSVADCVILCVQPGSGDSLQYMKAGITEIPDVALVTKADLGDVAIRTRRDLRSALGTIGRIADSAKQGSKPTPILSITADDQDGMAELIKAIDDHIQRLRGGSLDARRARQAEAWLSDAVRQDYGREGWRIAGGWNGTTIIKKTKSPIRRLSIILSMLAERLDGG